MVNGTAILMTVKAIWVLRTIIISNMKNAALTLFTIATISVFADSGVVTAADALTHEYVITVDANMSSMQVEATFGTRVQTITARSSDARKFIREVQNCDNDSRIRIRDGRLRLPDDGLSCLRYSVDLRKAAAAERRNESLSDRNIIVSPDAWFWRPRLRGNDVIIVRFNLPQSLAVSATWMTVPGEHNTYRLVNSLRSSSAVAAFGEFELVETQISGATLSITIMQPTADIDTDKIVEWVRATANNVVLAYGRFPNPATNVVVVPISGQRGRDDSAVIFGHVIRDGTETIELFVNQAGPIADYYESWIATHEFSHLMLPYISSRHRWMSEGFATYYQNVLMARANQYSEEIAWQKLWEGFERGRLSRPELSPNGAARAGIGGATMKIYWSGTAIALMADVELRQRSNGEESLDSVLEKLQECCLPSDRSWSGTELFRKLDSLIDEPVFMPLYRQYASAPGFPDVESLLSRLGVDLRDGEVQLQSSAPLAAIRSSIMGER